jgi:hypothetical protein
MPRICHACGAALAEAVTFCAACEAPVESGLSPTQQRGHSAAAIETRGRLRLQPGLAVAALGVLLLGTAGAFANWSSPAGARSIGAIASDNDSSMANPVRESQAPAETPAIVTTGDIARFPAIYKNRRIQLVGWGQGVFSWFGDAQKGDPRLDDCKFEILVGLSGGAVNGGVLGCIDKLKPEQRSDFYRSTTCHTTFAGSVKYVKCRNNPLGSHPPPDTSIDSTAWSNVVVDEDVILICTVKSSGLAGFAGITGLLTHCELSKSSSRKAEEMMEEREREMEKQEGPKPSEPDGNATGKPSPATAQPTDAQTQTGETEESTEDTRTSPSATIPTPPRQLRFEEGLRVLVHVVSITRRPDGSFAFRGTLLQPVALASEASLGQGTELAGSGTVRGGHVTVAVTGLTVQGENYGLQQTKSGANKKAGSGPAIELDPGKVIEMWFASVSVYEKTTGESH